MFAKKYPNMASETVGKLKRKSLKETFDSWWERNEHKIPKKYRIGIRQSADNLFDELFAIQSWEKRIRWLTSGLISPKGRLSAGHYQILK